MKRVPVSREKKGEEEMNSSRFFHFNRRGSPGLGILKRSHVL
jgi:hypothetical protein